MINLLPPDYANSIRFGRQNIVLRNWLFGMAAAILGLVIIFVGGWLYLDRQAQILQKNIDTTNQQLRAQNLDKVQKDAKEISGDIKVINQVLSSEVRFSDLIQVIGNDMPAGTVLGGLNISKLTGGIDLTINAKDHTSAAQAAVNLSDPANKLFSKLDVVTVSCNSDPTSTYQCTATFRALFSNEAKTRFINVPKELSK